MYMNINSSIKNNLFSIYSSNNQNFVQKHSIIKNTESRHQQDFLSISPLGKAKGIIESLMKQKQEIREKKQELIGKTLEKGEDMESIKSQLEAFEEQIKHIDDQIAKTMAEQIKEQTESLKKTGYNKTQTKEETRIEHLNSLINISSDLSQAQVVSSVKTKIDGEARVLATEINGKLTEANDEIRNSANKQLIQNEKQNYDKLSYNELEF